jgi:hypothetical protein
VEARKHARDGHAAYCDFVKEANRRRDRVRNGGMAIPIDADVTCAEEQFAQALCDGVLTISPTYLQEKQAGMWKMRTDIQKVRAHRSNPAPLPPPTP